MRPPHSADLPISVCVSFTSTEGLEYRAYGPGFQSDTWPALNAQRGHQA